MVLLSPYFNSSQSGSIIFVLFASIAMVGVIGAGAMAVLKGPVKSMSEVTKRTIAENNMIAAGKLALIAAGQQTGDCDSDGAMEPVEWTDPVGKPAPVQGGLIPVTFGASQQDPWGNIYGYCAWDHGSRRFDTTCGTHPRRLQGNSSHNNIVLAIISSGPDRSFQTTCNNEGGGNYLVKISGSDDVVLSYTYAEAVTMAGGLWNLDDNDPKVAEISKNLSVKDDSGTEQLSFNADSQEFALATGGTGTFPTIKTDFIQKYTGNSIEFLGNLKMGTYWLSGDGSDKGLKIDANGNVTTSNALSVTDGITSLSSKVNGVALIATAAGTTSIGLRAKGTSKAIESDGELDMLSHKITQLAPPTNDADAATKKYVDDKVGGVSQVIKCESFVFTTCTGAASHTLAKTNLGACKKACEAAGVQCCEAEFASLPGNPNIQLAGCNGHDAPSQTTGGVRNLLTILLGGGKFVSAFCYLE